VLSLSLDVVVSSCGLLLAFLLGFSDCVILWIDQYPRDDEGNDLLRRKYGKIANISL